MKIFATLVFAIGAMTWFTSDAQAQVSTINYSFDGDATLDEHKTVHTNLSGSMVTKTIGVKINGNNSAKKVFLYVGPCNSTTPPPPPNLCVEVTNVDTGSGTDYSASIDIPAGECLFVWEYDLAGSSEPDCAGSVTVS